MPSSSDWSPKGARRVESSRNHGRATARLVLLLLVGRGIGGLPVRAYQRPTVGWTLSRTDAGPRSLPATSIAWGAWSEIGQGRHLAQDQAMAIQPRTGPMHSTRCSGLSRAHTGYAPVAGCAVARVVRADPAVRRAFRNLDTGRAGANTIPVITGAADGGVDAAAGGLISDAISLILRRSVVSTLIRNTGWIRSATSNCVPASRPRRASGSARWASPPSAHSPTA